MMPLAILPEGHAFRHAIRATNLACIAGLSLLLASWTWTLLEPVLGRTATVPTAPVTTFDLSPIRSTALFGASPAASLPGPAISMDAQFKLSGVMAALGRMPGFAIIAVNGQPAKSYRLHDELSPGYRLSAIYPRYVTIQAPGGLSELHFETDKAPGTSHAGGAVPTGMPQQGAAVPHSIPRSALAAVQSPDTMRLLASSMRANPGQGVQVLSTPAGSLLATLALQAGDLITQVNGRSMADPQSLVALPQALQGDHVELVVRRNGVQQTFQYSIQ